jgi:cytoskeletal protein RodZ
MTDHQPIAEKIAPLCEIGSNLRQLRQDKSLTIEEVAERTRIQPRLLRALEEGRTDLLPEPVYIQGIIKKYGESMGVNGLELAKSVPAEQMQIVPLKNNRWEGFDRPQIRPIHLYLSYIAILLASISALSHALNSSVQTLETAQKTTAPLETKIASIGHTANIPNDPKLEQTSANGEPLQLRISAKSTSWIKVVVDGQPAFEGSLNAGNAKSWTAKRELILTTGNAGGIMVTENNTPIGELGAPGEKRQVKFSTKS